MELPKDFIERTEPILNQEWDDFYNALHEPSPTSIRVNRKKFSEHLALDRIPWCDSGYYLEQRSQFTFDPLFHAGAYYVQEASSMIIEQAIKQLIAGNIKALDLCAAPGGKTTLLSSLLSENSLLVSNEIIRNRANILVENTMKWGNPNVIVTNNKPEDYFKLTSYFDLVLVDAPCSGEGMFRKDKQAIEEWSVGNVELCACRQRDIISAVWDTLKPDGYLFYSTCTYNREENEETVEWICDTFNAEVVELKVENEWEISFSPVKGKATYHFFPHKTKGEGFYFAVIQKRSDESLNPVSIKFKSKKQNSKSKRDSIDYKSLLVNIESFTFCEEADEIKAFSTNYHIDLLFLKEKLNVIHAGIILGQKKGKDFIPHQSLALSNNLNRDKFNNFEVDWSTAISFLRKETLLLENAARGIVLLTYKNIPLGFVKNLGNRANNLYPNEWRIRSAYLPDKEVDVL